MFLVPVFAGGDWERTKTSFFSMLAGKAEAFPHHFNHMQEEWLCLQQSVQNWSKVVKNQAPLILCSTGALFLKCYKNTGGEGDNAQHCSFGTLREMARNSEIQSVVSFLALITNIS